MDQVQSPILNHDKIRKDFPIFGKFPDLVYLDNAATTQKPQAVIDRIADFYSLENANIHRGIYDLSHQATEAYEQARGTVANFINAEEAKCIAFTKGTTESINIVAQSWLRPRLGPGKNVVISLMEHHANLIPWQQMCKASGAELRVIPLTTDLQIDYTRAADLIDDQTQLLAVTHLSNTLGILSDTEKIKSLASLHNTPVLLDAAQSVALHELDVQAINCDFLVFSGHKLFGPMGIGALYVKTDHHRAMQPFEVGGGIIRNVQLDDTLFQSYPTLLEAGTPNVAGALGMESAIQYVSSLDRNAARKHLFDLSVAATEFLTSIPEIKLITPEPATHGIISFTLEEVHPHDVASFLNSHHIAVRAGMHCTQPLLESLGQPSTIRASFSIYNSLKDVRRLASTLKEIVVFWKA